MKSAGGDCPGQTLLQQQENVKERLCGRAVPGENMQEAEHDI